MGKRVQVSLTISESADPDQVAGALAALGLTVERVMHALGVIVGEADEDNLEQLRGAPNVAAVEKGRGFKLPPPDSPVQ